jgi:hypothetical protein
MLVILIRDLLSGTVLGDSVGVATGLNGCDDVKVSDRCQLISFNLVASPDRGSTVHPSRGCPALPFHSHCAPF